MSVACLSVRSALKKKTKVDLYVLAVYPVESWAPRLRAHEFRVSVCLTVTRVLCVKTAERIIEILSLSDRPPF